VAELGGIRLIPPDTPTANFGFDVTPARLVTGLITERGLCPATPEGLLALYPERAASARSGTDGAGAFDQ
jgi:methylthioribose-1-phosphate isomerase